MRRLVNHIPCGFFGARSWFFICLPLFCYGCSSDDSSGASTLAYGNISSLDGQSLSLEGVEIFAPASGVVTTSDVDGDFDLGLLPASLQDLVVTIPPSNGWDERTLIAEVDFSRGGTSHVTISVVGSRMDLFAVASCGDDENHLEAEIKFQCDGLEGEIELEVEDDGTESLEIELEGPGLPDPVTGRLVNPATGVEVLFVMPMEMDENGEPEAEVELTLSDTALTTFVGLQVEFTNIQCSTDPITVPPLPDLSSCDMECRGKENFGVETGVHGHIRTEIKGDGDNRLKLRVEGPGVMASANVTAQFQGEIFERPMILDEDELEVEFKLDFRPQEGGMPLPLEKTNVTEFTDPTPVTIRYTVGGTTTTFNTKVPTCAFKN